MDSFESIYRRAVARKGGEGELKRLLPEVLSPDAIAGMRESRFLAEMTRCIFQAGFVWKIIDHKWPGFEDVFHGFEPDAILSLLPADWDEIGRDRRIVRNHQKIRTVRVNAQFIDDVVTECGSFGRFIADWPASDLAGLFDILKKRGARLGGNTGQRFLRNIGRDTYVLTGDVVACLRGSGVDIRENPTSGRDLARIQQAFNEWREESGLPYAHISKIAACSVG